MEILKSSKAIALAATAVMVASLFWLLNTQRINGSLEAGLEKEKLKSEELLSEKLSLEKDLEKIKTQLAGLKNENGEANNLYKAATAKLQQQEADYTRMKRENLSLGKIKKQREALIKLQSELENDLQVLKIAYTELEQKNNNLNNTVEALQERNRILTDDLNRALFAAVDQSQIQAVKGKNERLTVRAKKTKKLIATFEVPANLKNLSFRILDSRGNPLAPKDGTIAFVATPSENNYIASSNAEVLGNKLQQIEMVYIPKEKLKTGVYTVEILNESLYVGSLKVKLK